MAGLLITGQMKVLTLQEGFLKEFGSHLAASQVGGATQPNLAVGVRRNVLSSAVLDFV